MKNKKVQNTIAWLLLAVALTFSLTLSGRSLLHESLRLDEAQSLWVTMQTPEALLNWVSEDVHVPLYHMLLHIWGTIFGFELSTARYLSTTFFVLGVAILFAAAQKITNLRTAWTAAVLTALSPFLTWYAFEVRMYTLFFFVTVAQLYFFIDLIQTEGRKGKMGMLLTSIIGVYTHYFFFFLLGVEVLYTSGATLFQAISRKNWRPISQFRTPAIILGLILLAVASLAPWVLQVLSRGAAMNASPKIPAPTSYTLFQTIIQLMLGYQDTEIMNTMISLWPLALILLFYLFTKRTFAPLKQGGFFVLLILLPLLSAFFVSEYRSIFITRYFTLIAPALLILIAWLINAYGKKMSLFIIVSVITLFSSALIYQNTNAASPVKENYARAAQIVMEHTSPYDVVAISAPFTIYPFEYYYRQPNKVITVPNWDRYQGKPVDPYSLENFVETVQQYEKRYDHLTIVLSYDQGFEAELVAYLDQHYARTLLEEASTGLMVRQYQLRY